MKKIMCATDFSSNAGKALAYAIRLAKANQARLIILNIYEVPTKLQYDGPTAGLSQEAEAQKASMHHLGVAFSEQAGAVEVVPEFATFRAATVDEGILQMIKKHDPDVLVVGTHGFNRMRELLFGSTTRSLIKRVDCPLFVVPENAPAATQNPMKKFVYASALNENDIPAIQDLLALSTTLGAKITILHVFPLNLRDAPKDLNWFKTLLQERVDSTEVEFEILYSENTFEALTNYIEENKVDLLAMLEQRTDSLLKSIFHRDLVQRLGFTASTPMLRYKED